MIAPIVKDLLATAENSVDEIRAKISNVKMAPYEGGTHLQITFDLNNKKFLGVLKGRNRDLCVGFGEEQDRAIALRVLLDGHADEITGN